MAERDDTAATILNDAPPRAIQLAEVLNNIFCFCSTAVLLKCALVSHLWSDVTLDHIWGFDPPFMALIMLLGPVGLATSKRMSRRLKFTRVIKVEDWEHFSSYARRVRSFDLATTFQTEPRGEIDDILCALALSRPTLSILPNVDALTINGDRGEIWLQSAGLFLRPGLSTIKISNNGQKLLPALFGQITDRSNLLTKLVIETDLSVFHFIDDFERMLSGLQRLRAVYLPSYTMTSRILDILATLPHLTVAYSSRPTYACVDGWSNVESLQIKVQEGVFSSLSTLRLQGSLINIANMASSSHGFTANLETFDIDIVSKESEMSLQRFLDSLSESCPDIRTLRFHLPLFMADLYRDVPEDPITYGTLATIAKWKALECFSLSFVQRIDISDFELVSLLSECENLKHLDLNCEPWSLGIPALTLGFMSLLPPTCQLETLSVHVDARRLDNLQLNAPRLRHKLKKLCFGISPSEDTGRVALYLSGILPERCVLDVKPRLPTTSVDRNHPSYAIINMSRDHRKKWESIKDLLPLLLEARSLERQSVMKALRGESIDENLNRWK